jgi:hypothetical protein
MVNTIPTTPQAFGFQPRYHEAEHGIPAGAFVLADEDFYRVEYVATCDYTGEVRVILDAETGEALRLDEVQAVVLAGVDPLTAYGRFKGLPWTLSSNAGYDAEAGW